MQASAPANTTPYLPIEEQKFEPEVPEVKEEVLQTVQVTQIAIVEKAAEDKKILSNEERTETQTTFGTHNQEGVDDPDKVKEAEKLVQVVHHEEPPKPVIEEKKEEPKRPKTAHEDSPIPESIITIKTAKI